MSQDVVPTVVVTPSKDVDENKERGNWGSQFEFLLSCLSYAVGLGNIWRFPYLCYRNGGGAFLIPYFTMLSFVGIPLFFMELSFGQYASEGPITIWKVSPLFQGIGYAMFLMSSLVGVYYNMILAWAFFYLWSSITSMFSDLPWKGCENEWNTHMCQKFARTNCTAHKGVLDVNGTCFFPHEIDNKTYAEYKALKVWSKTASDEYFHNYVLDLTEGLHDLGGIRYELVVCLFLCWAIVFFCLSRGVKTMGKVVYFTALFPYVVLIILLIRGLSLPGADKGIMFYLTPEWHRLLDARVWGDAAMQIFFSLSPCWGGLITLASYNKFHNNCLKDTFFICIGNCGTSFFAGFVIFSIVGFMAHNLGIEVSEVASQGAGLAFVVYPEAVARLPLAPFWSTLFFFMLMTLGMGTQFTIVETVVTTIVDTWPERLRHRKPLVLLCICSAMFALGSVICTRGGMYVLQLMDDYVASYSALTIGLTEVIVIGWVYEADRFLDDIKVMLKKYPFPRVYWKLIWKFVVPSLISMILGFSLYQMEPTRYGGYVYPGWATALGWTLSLVSVSAIPGVAIYKLSRSRGDYATRLKVLMEPTADWGPKLQVHRIEAHSPKHTDSQVPLALPNYNPDGDLDLEPDFPVYYNSAKASGQNAGSDDAGDSGSEHGISLNIPRSRQTGL
ncbi:sodium- and chloride-dependent glycine transporter 1-like isoform X2 [Varroa jacobsoni]|nr:sodium- and chloride-dependent glycine transporter 1-like isoform X2 [Varroa destructor]XP_022696525.1 sodium- and chloride-dependent glycine transporter 1-like isoform X2 [Varroa jacobsoni]